MWPFWACLSSLRTAMGLWKANLVKWGYESDGCISCHCAEEQTMAHLISFPVLPTQCTKAGPCCSVSRSKIVRGTLVRTRLRLKWHEKKPDSTFPPGSSCKQCHSKNSPLMQFLHLLRTITRKMHLCEEAQVIDKYRILSNPRPTTVNNCLSFVLYNVSTQESVVGWATLAITVSITRKQLANNSTRFRVRWPVAHKWTYCLALPPAWLKLWTSCSTTCITEGSQADERAGAHFRMSNLIKFCVHLRGAKTNFRSQKSSAVLCQFSSKHVSSYSKTFKNKFEASDLIFVKKM